MTYLRRSKRPHKGALATTIIVGALIVIFGINYFFPSAYPTILFPIASVAWKAESSVVGFFGAAGEIVRSKYSLVRENENLSAELAARDQSLLIRDTLQSENDALKAQLGRAAAVGLPGKDALILGTILVRPPVSLYDTLVIDIGSNDGIKQGDKVYAEGDTLLGDISDVFAGESKVALYSAPGRETSVLVGTTTIAAQATGKGGGNFTLKLPAQTPLAVGAVVTVPQLRSRVLGVVDRILVDSSDSVQTVLFRSPANISQLRFVEVDKGVAPSVPKK